MACHGDCIHLLQGLFSFSTKVSLHSPLSNYGWKGRILQGETTNFSVLPLRNDKEPFFFSTLLYTMFGLPQWLKNPPASAGDTGDAGLIPGSGKSPGGGNGNPLQYSCLEKSMDRGAWWATVHGVTKSQTWLITWTHRHVHNV